VNALVPSAPAEIDLETQKLVAELDNAARKRAWGVKVSKLVGYDRNGLPDYPQVTLEAGVGAYGQPVASVKVQQTRTNSSDFAGTLKDLDVRTAVEYYTRLNSADAIDAVEKVMRAPTPKAWALITLLDRMAQLNQNKEIEQK